MNTCETCKHWSQEFGGKGRFGWCGKAGFRPESWEMDVTDVMFFATYEDSLVLTRSDFGCILHEPKEVGD